jgi:hypothetical protein
MAPRPLTTAEVNILTRSGLGVRLSPDTLTTRTALYERDPESQRWLCLQGGLRVGHTTSLDGRGMRWNPTDKTFEPCTCPRCQTTPRKER